MAGDATLTALIPHRQGLLPSVRAVIEHLAVPGKRRSASSLDDPDHPSKQTAGESPPFCIWLTIHFVALNIRHSGMPASRSPSSTRCMLLLKAAVPIDGLKVCKVVFGQSLR
jgi:hypothetical protein